MLVVFMNVVFHKNNLWSSFSLRSRPIRGKNLWTSARIHLNSPKRFWPESVDSCIWHTVEILKFCKYLLLILVDSFGGIFESGFSISSWISDPVCQFRECASPRQPLHDHGKWPTASNSIFILLSKLMWCHNTSLQGSTVFPWHLFSLVWLFSSKMKLHTFQPYLSKYVMSILQMGQSLCK